MILAWRNTRLLHRCLAALARHRTRTDFETVVVLNGAADEVVTVIDTMVTGATVVRSSVNLGFSGGCNRGARAARGEFLVFLNDDTEVDDGWLDALVETADRHPQAGAVGSRVRDPYGTLQEAGGILWRNASVWHVGRLVADSTSRYRHVRRVAYCSACALLVRRSTWDAVGGFDEGYFPGYYEDVDLCLKIASLGQSVLYQPRARLLHHGGGDIGSLAHDFKAFVSSRSRERFLSRWGDELATFPAPPVLTPPDPRAMPTVERATEQARGLPLRVLVLDRRPSIVDPDAMAVLAELAGSHYAVSLGAAGDLGENERDELGDAGIDILDDVGQSLAGTLAYDVVVAAGRHLFEAWAPAVATTQAQAPVVFWALDDADAANARALMGSDLVVCPSPRLATVAAAEGARTAVVLEPQVRPHPRPAPGFGPRRDVLAAGPAAGIRWLADEVMPLVAAGAPEARLQVPAHALPDRRPSSLLSVARSDARTEDRPPRVVAATSLSAAIGAVASGVPVVVTPYVAADLSDDLRPAVVVADEAVSLAAELVALLTDRRAWERRRRVIDDVARLGERCGRWTDALDGARHARL